MALKGIKMAIWASLIGAGVAAYGNNQQQGAIGTASAAQQAANQQALAEQRRQYELSQNNLSPWLQAGREALQAQRNLMGLSGGTGNQLSALASSPGYQFRLQQGQQALESGLASRGGMGSGRAMTAANEYGQNFASNEYNNRLNQLAGLSGTGQTTAQNLGNLGANYAQNYGGTLQSGANALGSAAINAANATQSSLLGGANLGMGIYRARNQNQPNYSGTNANYYGGSSGMPLDQWLNTGNG